MAGGALKLNKSSKQSISNIYNLTLLVPILEYDAFDRYLLMKLLIALTLTLGVTCWQLPWTKPEDLNRGLPLSVQIYTLNTTDSPFGTSLTGGFAKISMNDTNLELVVKDTNGDALGYFPKTPMQYAQQQENVVYAVINGGYFNMAKNISASFLAQNGKVKCPNQINTSPNHNPTVGAFGVTAEGKTQIQYVYSFGTHHDTYKYRYPNSVPGPVPRQDDGVHWDVAQGIGAGPILVKNTNIIDGNVQNFDYKSMIDFRHPRSAICFDSLNNIYFVSLDGRQQGADGLKMPELARVMQSLHCLDAMNLDGGGSTLLYANDKIINRPSDASGPRPVVSAILIRDRFKKKLNLATS